MSISAPYLPHYKNEKLTSIVLPVDAGYFEHFPESVTWKDVRLEKKDEFHVTLLHVQKVLGLSHRPTDDTVSFFNSFTEANPVGFMRFVNDLRYVEEEEKKTILTRCEVSNLDRLFAELNRGLGIDMPTQPAHVTLYALQKNAGIHVNSAGEMEGLEQVHLPELEEAFKKIRLV